MTVHQFSTPTSLVQTLTTELAQLSQNNRPVHIALSGGSTPKAWFKFLASSAQKNGIEWANVNVWWVDERFVPHSDSQSNFGEATRLLWDKISMPLENLHPIRFSDDIYAEVSRYSAELAERLNGSDSADSQDLKLDWVLLGVGEDGHTASLFPGQTDYESTAPVIACVHPDSGQPRVSLSAQLIASANRVSFVVTGTSKYEIFKRTGPQSKPDSMLPASKVRSSDGDTDWFIDDGAALGLDIGE